MNDELSGQLGWKIPDYAQGALWLETESGLFRVEGETGLFALAAPTQALTLRWGNEAGPALAHLKWKADNLKWNGVVRLGGMVEALHLMELPAMETSIAVIHFTGRPLRSDALPYAPPKQRQKASYTPPDFLESLEEAVEDTTTTWLVGDDSPLFSLAQDALTNKLRLWVSGRLAEASSGWETLFALPLLLESVTLFAD
jgi:hypothetical protein